MATMKYSEHGSIHYREFPDLNHAMVAAYEGLDRCEFLPKKIFDDGKEYSEEDMDKYWDEHNIRE